MRQFRIPKGPKTRLKFSEHFVETMLFLIFFFVFLTLNGYSQPIQICRFILFACMMRHRSRTPRKLENSQLEVEKHEDEMEETEETEESMTETAGTETYAWHFDMLHDAGRLRAFCDAFKRVPKEVLEHPVLDIGCGSGILGLSLLQQRPELEKVIAFESDPMLAEVARENAVKNALATKLTVHPVRSTRMRRAKRKDRGKLVVAEILDAGLLGEDCLGTLRHASKCLLQEDYFAIPASAEVSLGGVKHMTFFFLIGHIILV